MPKANKKQDGLLDTWGRKNRKLKDIKCLNCQKTFRPPRKTSKYCSQRCRWDNNGKNPKRVPSSWSLDHKGYLAGFVWCGNLKRNMKYHRWIMENHIGRKLKKDEVIHHINENKLDNRIENLQIMSNEEHTKHHNDIKRLLKEIEGE